MEYRKNIGTNVFEGALFGNDAVLENQPFPTFAYNDTPNVIELISISKASYLEFMKTFYDINKHPTGDLEVKGSKTHLMQILDKPRNFRTGIDIEAVASYLRNTVCVFELSVIYNN